MSHIVSFFPQNPWPTRSGAHRRCLELMRGFKALGHRVTLLSSNVSTVQPWTEESVRALQEKGFADAVYFHSGSTMDGILKQVPRLFRLTGQFLPLRSPLACPPGLRHWFQHQSEQLAPDVLLMNYATWDVLVDRTKPSRCLEMLDTYDLVTLNQKMWKQIGFLMRGGPINPETVPEEILHEDYFERFGFTADNDEYAICDSYDRTIAITDPEADDLRRHTKRTEVVTLPMTMEPVPCENTYAGGAIYFSGHNPFNVQGYLFFARRVLPQVRKLSPDFHLDLAGYCSQRVTDVPNVQREGYIPDLKAAYANARFALCPVYGLTGQQIKIVEAMAHGVPVVALHEAASRSPMVHEQNGLIAHTAEEFAEHTVRLWKDPLLCRRLGDNARATIRAEFSQERLLEGLEHTLRPVVPSS